MMYMPYIILAVCAFCLASSSWRWTSLIVGASCLINLTAVNMWLIPTMYPGGEITDYNIYFVAGLIDAITAYTVWKFGDSGRRKMAGILSMFVLTNALLLFGNHFVYSEYGPLIFGLNVAQIMLFSGGVCDSAKIYYDAVIGLLGGRPSPGISNRHSDTCGG